MNINQDIINKVETLDKERNMKEYRNAFNADTQLTHYAKNIAHTIQYRIFDADKQFEDNKLSIEELNQQANIIKQNIFSLLYIQTRNKKHAWSLIKPLDEFHHMETRMRGVDLSEKHKNELPLPTSQSPLEYNIQTFYILKSCDIFLQRELYKILLSTHDTKTQDLTIRKFDQLGEVVDDLMDVEEDINAINSNRFLISLVHQGYQTTLKEYRAFADQQMKIIRHNRTWLEDKGIDIQQLNHNLNYQLKDQQRQEYFKSIKHSATNDLIYG